MALVGLAVTIAAFYPGLVTTDSIAQYEQAVSGVYSDAHPPVMAWLWSGLLHFVPGAGGLLWLHATLLWLALYLFADGAALRGARHAWLVVAVGFLPPILGTAGEIWKDVGMAAALLCAAAIVYRASARGAPIGRAAAAMAIVPLFYATAVRANAPAASGPVLVYWVMCVWPQLSLRRAVAAATGVLVLLMVAQWGLESRVIGARRAHLAQQLETFDLAAVRCAGGETVIPPIFMQAGARDDALCASFDPSRVDPLYSLPNSPLRQDTDRTGLRDLASSWRHAVLANPIAYLAHRVVVMEAVLGFGVSDASRSIWIPFSVANPYGLNYAYNGVAAAIGTSVSIAAAMGLYNGMPWLALAIGIAAAALWRQGRAYLAETSLALSALLYALAYLVVGIASDYRYIYWTVLASAVAGASILARDRRWSDALFRAFATLRPQLPTATSSALAAVGFALTIVAYAPGELTFDSVWQYNQAVIHSYGDHHPPLMAWLWSVVDRGIHGPLGMLLLQAVMMWTALLLIADGAHRRGLVHTWLVIAVGFLPPILGIEGEIWKDVQMAASLLLAFALVYRGSVGEGRMCAGWMAAALIPLFYGTAIRANASAAVLPIAVYWGYALLRPTSLRRALVVGTLLVMGLLGAQAFVDRVLLEARRDYLAQFLAVFDIAAIRCGGGDATIPAALLRPGHDVASICGAFDPYKVDYLFATADAPLRRSSNRATVDALTAEWIRAIRADPMLYVRHRIRAFGALLGFGTQDDDERRPVWIPGSIPNAYGFTFEPNLATEAIGIGARAARAVGLYNGLPWLLLAIVALAGIMRHPRAMRRDAGAIALATSALLYTLPYAVIAIAPDYRYLLWTVVASAVAGILMVLPKRHFTAFAARCRVFGNRLRRGAVRNRTFVAAIALAALGFALQVIAFYPGVMSYDSLLQYEQAIGTQPYTDHHPAIMAWIWSLLLHVVPGPAPMLLLHAAMTWTALALFAVGAHRRGVRHAWLLPLAGLTPMIIGMQGPIWKDVGMTAAFMLGTAIMYAGRAGPRLAGPWIVGALPLFYATAVRANAPAAALPFLVLAARRLLPRRSLQHALALGIALLAALLALQWGLARALHVKRAHFTQYIEAFDIAAIQCGGGDAALPTAFLLHGSATMPVCAAFDPIQVDFLFANGDRTPLIASDDRAALREFGAAWRHAVAANPGLYLAHRARVFTAAMGVGVPDARRALFMVRSLDNAYGFVFMPNALTNVIGMSVNAAAALGLTNGFTWLGLALIVIVVAIRRLPGAGGTRDVTDETALALAASAIAYTLPYFFVGVAPDLRYLDWTMAATLVAALLVALPRSADTAGKPKRDVSR